MASEPAYHQVAHFRGYITVPQDVFDQITPFTLRDQNKMMVLTRGMEITPELSLSPDTQLPAIEWNGYLIVPAVEDL